MQQSRRKFLKTVAATGAMGATVGGTWLSLSSSPYARMGRQILRESVRSPAPAPVTPDPSSWDSNRVTFSWLGHGTVLINFFGVHVLTDPAFSERVGVDARVTTLGPRRWIKPALKLSQLPPVDLIVLSHAHMDHLDIPSLRYFAADIPVITARDTSEFLQSTRLRRVTEMDWSDKTTVRTGGGEMRVEAFEVRHWGRRWPRDRDRGYNGYVLRREGCALLFGGDTAMTDRFAALRPRGPFAAALMPIGAYDPWIHSHCTPEEAVAMADAAGAKLIAPIHHQTFKLSEEPREEPLERIEQALEEEEGRLALRCIGETVVLS